MRIAVVLAAVVVLLAGCGNSYDRQLSWIEWFFALGKTGSSPDYILVKSGFAGPDKVAVIFGFMDDGAFCNEIARMYMDRYPEARYYCVPAN